MTMNFEKKPQNQSQTKLQTQQQTFQENQTQTQQQTFQENQLQTHPKNQSNNQPINQQQASQELQGKIVAITVLLFVLILIFGLGFLFYTSIQKLSDGEANKSEIKESKTQVTVEKNEEKNPTETTISQNSNHETSNHETSNHETSNHETSNRENGNCETGNQINEEGMVFFYQTYIEENYNGDEQALYNDTNYLSSYDFMCSDCTEYLDKPVCLYGYITEIDRDEGYLIIHNSDLSDTIAVKLYCAELAYRNINLHDFGQFYFLLLGEGVDCYRGKLLFESFHYNSDDGFPKQEKSLMETLEEYGISLEVFEVKEKYDEALLAVVDNPDGNAFQCEVTAAYYDKNDKLLGTEIGYLSVFKGELCDYLYLNAKNPETDEMYEFDHFSYDVSLKDLENPDLYKDKYECLSLIDYKYYNKDEKMHLEIKNKSDKVSGDITFRIFSIDENNQVVGDLFLGYVLNPKEKNTEIIDLQAGWKRSIVLLK